MTRREQIATTHKLHQEQAKLAYRLVQEAKPRAKEDQLKTYGENRPILHADKGKLRKQRRFERLIGAGNVKVHHFSSQTILPKTLKREKSPGV